MRIEHGKRGAPLLCRRLLGAIAGLGFLTALAGCPGTLRDKERFLGDAGGGGSGGGGACPDVLTTIFAEKCGTSGCHGATNPAQNLDLVSPGVAERVVGKGSDACMGALLADPSAPDYSLLYTKLLEKPPCGSQMPLVGDKLSDVEMECVKQWIAEQAPAPTGAGGAGGMGGAGGAGGAGGG